MKIRIYTLAAGLAVASLGYQHIAAAASPVRVAQTSNDLAFDSQAGQAPAGMENAQDDSLTPYQILVQKLEKTYHISFPKQGQ